VHFEPWFAAAQAAPARPERLDQDEALTGVMDALSSLAAFARADALEISRVTPRRLRPPLARLLPRPRQGSHP
jgi:hypothetical protein